jgi:hypothetical protein
MHAADARRLAAVYFLIQAAAVPLWWAMLFAVPASQSWFLPRSGLDPMFAILLVPDLGVLSLGSGVAGALELKHHHRSRDAAWLVVGAALYATVYTIAWTILIGAPALSAGLMLAAGTASVASARSMSTE